MYNSQYCKHHDQVSLDQESYERVSLDGALTRRCCVLCCEGEEIGMLEDMEIGISDLHRVSFKITEAKTDDLSDRQPSICGRR